MKAGWQVTPNPKDVYLLGMLCPIYDYVDVRYLVIVQFLRCFQVFWQFKIMETPAVSSEVQTYVFCDVAVRENTGFEFNSFILSSKQWPTQVT